MKKTIVILSIILSLFSLSSCNLDNEGILWRNIGRTVSDNKNRKFIDVEENGNSFYMITENGLEKGAVNGSSYSESVILDSDAFTKFYQDFGVIYSDGTMIYLDYVESDMNFYAVSLNEPVSIKPLSYDGLDNYKLVGSYKDDGTVVFLGSTAEENSTAQLFTASYSADSGMITFTAIEGSSIPNFVTSYDGLIYADGKYTYDGNTIKISSGEKNVDFAFDDVKSFTTNGTEIYIIRNSDSTFYVYKGQTGSAQNEILVEQIATVGGSYSRSFPSYCNGKYLYFVDANGTSSASRFITIDVTADDEGNYEEPSNNGTSNGMEAEAIFEISGNIYVLSENHGLFQVQEKTLKQL